MALDHSCQVQRHTLAERQRDEYDTPLPALTALLRVESIGPVGTRILEPCAGKGNLVVPLRAAGYEVIASDISDRGCPDCTVADFFRSGPAARWLRHLADQPALLLRPSNSFATRSPCARGCSCCCCAWHLWKQGAAPIFSKAPASRAFTCSIAGSR